ncbi:molybdenum cofactor guanylyltransferase MobA [Jannaschia sp. W003]|uniref:molybdenum cofactor guanylyltransferase MobA n=1 Tax=Jannaschia sp. W003 TaxID=2867012 RepID=UPI0021A741D1|nr:molybdenum cofactor guanylyltransferase MobA [Jannaschia sp. W003]
MGGGDKGRLVVRGRPLVAHVVARLEGQAAPLALNANGDPKRWADLGLPVLSDTVPGHPGPLAGVLAGMEWAASLGADAVISAAADTPFLPLDLAGKLHAAAGPSGLALASAGGRPQPTFGLWPVALRGDLRAALEGGTRKVLHWTDRHGAGYAEFPEAAFFNVNTPEDLAEADR